MFYCVFVSGQSASVTNQDLSKYNITRPLQFQVVLVVSTQNQRGTCMAYAVKLCNSAERESSPVWKLSSRFCSQSICLSRRGKVNSPGTQRLGFTDTSGCQQFSGDSLSATSSGHIWQVCPFPPVSLCLITLLSYLFYLRVVCTFISLHSFLSSYPRIKVPFINRHFPMHNTVSHNISLLEIPAQ